MWLQPRASPAQLSPITHRQRDSGRVRESQPPQDTRANSQRHLEPLPCCSDVESAQGARNKGGLSPNAAGRAPQGDTRGGVTRQDTLQTQPRAAGLLALPSTPVVELATCSQSAGGTLSRAAVCTSFRKSTGALFGLVYSSWPVASSIDPDMCSSGLGRVLLVGGLYIS